LLTRIAADGKRFVVRADEKLTAFMELESAISMAQAAFRNTATKFRVRSLGVTSKADCQAMTYIKIRRRLTRQIRYRAAIIASRQVR
jgi:hypothetical protein